MYGCESWTIKKAKCGRTDAFELWLWRRLLRVPGRSNQSILKEIYPEYSLEGLMLKLKLHHFGQLMWRANSSEKTLMLGKIEDGWRRGWQRMRWLDGITDSMGVILHNLWEIVKNKEAWRVAIHGVSKSQTWQQLNKNKNAWECVHMSSCKNFSCLTLSWAWMSLRFSPWCARRHQTP